MGALDLSALPKNALLVIDSAPVIYVLENREFAERFRPLLELQRTGAIRLAITTTAIVEVLTGPYATGDEALARRYRAMFDSWQVVPLDVPIAESAARLRAELRLKLADAIRPRQRLRHQRRRSRHARPRLLPRQRSAHNLLTAHATAVPGSLEPEVQASLRSNLRGDRERAGRIFGRRTGAGITNLDRQGR